MKTAETVLEEVCNEHSYSNFPEAAINGAGERMAIEAMNIFANQSKWVSVETPPKEGQSVFFWYESRSYGAGKYEGGAFVPRIRGLFFKDPVTYWMPVTEPPKS